VVVNPERKVLRIEYDVKAEKNFVACNFLDSTHGYIVPAGLFLYIDRHINTPVTVSIQTNREWNDIVTGLDAVPGKSHEFFAPDFDILYDCPLLIGKLEELPSFSVNGIEHRFIGYKMGDFDRKVFMNNLKKVVQAATSVIGEIPYRQYTFIGIGPGQGGIEHANNTTISFDGKGLNKADGMHRTMNFLAHEYFHHYNVKRIRPFELGPFDYDRGSRTNLLWVSEGLSVYYEYLIVKRAGLISEASLFSDFSGNINAFENSPGRLHQSLTQASYRTWSDGPFGGQVNGADKTISYYDKGPVVGLLLDFEIRHLTENRKSLDDVIRFLYWRYYKELGRGFTDAEFQQACEEIAGASLGELFEYVYTAKELDYNKYLAYAGLKIESQKVEGNGKTRYSMQRLDSADERQRSILDSWMGVTVR
jgi:predicted metalloprotease with PDZ domain